MSNRTTHLTVAALALALALTGCSSSSDDETPSAAASPTAGAAGDAGGTYESAAEIRAALEENGVPCEEPQEGTFPDVSEAQSCIVNGAEDVVLLRFASDEERETYLAEKEELASAVLGENWAVQTVLRETADQIQDALGGELVAGATE